MLPKEKLIELYVDKRLTTYEIAELCKVNRKTICRWFKFYDIKIDSNNRKFEHLKRIPLTKEQKEFVIGTLLGDGHMALHGRKNKSCRLMISHCDKQKDLVLWKKEILGNFVNVVRKKIDKQNHISWEFTTITHNEFKQFRDLFYIEHKKVVNKNLINFISPLSIAVWVMDDGHLNKNCNIRISTDDFSLEDNIILQEMLYIKFDIRVKICKYLRNNKIFYYLSFNKENSIKLSNLIKEYIIPCMEYKIINPKSSTTERQALNNSDDIV